MSTDELSPDQVADFLQHNPDFLRQHAALFASLQVPHPHEHRTISLGERQILALRARVKDLEWKLAGLVHNAAGNQKISQRLTDWCELMLAEPNPERLPAYVLETLADVFELPDVALRHWGAEPAPDAAGHAEAAAWLQTLERPYCGPATDQPVLAWLAAPAVSVAILPLHAPGSATVSGALVLGADAPERFTADMDTVFLETLARLAAAALSRCTPGAA